MCRDRGSWCRGDRGSRCVAIDRGSWCRGDRGSRCVTLEDRGVSRSRIEDRRCAAIGEDRGVANNYKRPKFCAFHTPHTRDPTFEEREIRRMWIQVRTMDGRKSARVDSLSKLTTI